MATSNLSFGAQVEAWVRQSRVRMEAVLKESTQRTVSIATTYLSGGLVNVQTGYLRASVRASLSTMPLIDKNAAPVEGQNYAYNGTEVSLTIAGAELGATIYIGYTARYAIFVHDGTSKMAPRPWVELAAMRWPQTVAEVVADLKARAAGQG